MTTIARLTRQFTFGATVLADPDPNLSPEEVLKIFAPNYPFLASATVGEPVVRGAVLEYPVLKPAVQTKGATGARAAEVEAACRALETWAAAPAPNPVTSALWAGVSGLVEEVLHRPDPGLRDVYSIPLA